MDLLKIITTVCKRCEVLAFDLKRKTMKSIFRRLFAWVSMLALMMGVASGLSGCGGGGGSSSSPPQAPLITAQPSDLTVVTGQPATFTVAANGDAPITYQWRRGGVNIDGATAASYTLALPQLADSGSVWSVVISNAAGSMTSAGAILTVTGPGIRLVAGMPGGAGSIDGAVGRFYGPSGVAVDATGTVFVADTSNNTIRKISPAGVVSTLAGTAGVIGAANGTGTAASFNRPTGIAFDKAGNILVADSSNSLIRQITPLGAVTTLAGTVGSTVAVDGPVATATFTFITGVATDNTGNVFVTDGVRLRKINTAGQISTLWVFPGAVGGPVLTGLATDAAGVVYVLSLGGTVYKITPDGTATIVIGPGGICATLSYFAATGIALDATGNFYIAATSRNRIFRITPSCVETTLAGGATDAAGSIDGTTNFSGPASLTLDAAGNIYVADTNNNTIRKITTDGKVVTLAGAASNAGATNGTGAVARFNNAGIFWALFPLYIANSGPPGASPLAYAGGVAVDAAGIMYVADTGNNIIRKITVDGVVTTVAGIAGVPGSLDGAAAAATFTNPSGVALDGAGNIYVADSGNHKIRKISLAGIVTTIAGSDWEDPQFAGRIRIKITTGSLPVAMAFDAAGNIYVADPGVRVIRKIAVSGTQTKFDFATSSLSPRALVADAQGNVYAAISCGIVKITAGGTIVDFVGMQDTCGTNDGLGNIARFQDPSGLALDTLGNLYVADTGNHTIRKVTPAGAVTTIAGRAGVGGLVFGNLPGTLHQPVGMAIDANGLLYTTSENTVLKIQLQ